MAQRNKKIFRKLKHNYRLVLREENSLEEKNYVKLNLLNLLMLTSIILTFFGIIFFFIFKFTPLGDYIRPSQFTGDSKELLLNTDKYLTELSARNEVNIQREAQLRIILSGEEMEENLELLKDEYSSPLDLSLLYNFKEVPKKNKKKKTSKTELAAANKRNNTMFSPLKGKISRGFNLQHHPAVDVIPDKYDAVNSILDGIVIFASWTPEFGHVIALQHSNNLISIYKHNSVLFKKVGTFVDAGESIAVVGNSGELTSGKHLHFELWKDGRAVDPENYVSF